MLGEVNQELKVYDLLGLTYFYQGNLQKAYFFHNKMIKGERENSLSLIK